MREKSHIHPESLDSIRHAVIYRHLGGTPEDGLLSCGFMRKTGEKSQIDFSIPYYSCLLLLQGSGEYWDETGVRAALAVGSVVQRLPGRIHSTKVDADGMWLEFYISFGRGFYDAMEAVGLFHGAPVGRAEPQQFLDAFRRLLQEMESANDTELFPVLLTAERLAAELVNPRQSSPLAGKESMTARARVLLESDLHREISPRQVAAKLCVGYENFRKRFTAETGMAPNLYRLEKKMMTARLMLLGGQSVEEVAAALGYSDAYAFSKQFKRRTGLPPGRYSREARQRSVEFGLPNG